MSTQNKKLTIIINGKGGVGKDALCDSLAARYRVCNRSSITPIKEIARQHGWNGEKDFRSRRFLAELKRVFSEYNDLPTKYLLDEHAKFMQSNDEVLFVHIREADQIATFVLAIGGNCKTLLIRRDVEGSQGVYGNRADDNVEDYPYDIIFDNNKLFEESSSDFAALIDGLMAD